MLQNHASLRVESQQVTMFIENSQYPIYTMSESVYRDFLQPFADSNVQRPAVKTSQCIVRGRILGEIFAA